MSKGPHKLLKEGAKLVADINDIFEEFGQLKFFEFEDKKFIILIKGGSHIKNIGS